MRVRSTSVYVGPNLYARFPVIRQVVDLGPLEDWPTARLGQGFVDALVAALPGLEEHGCSYGTPGGFLRRMREDEGTWLGHVLEHVAIELQNVAGSAVTFGKTRGTGREGEYDMIFEYHQKDVGLEAADLGRRLLLALLPDAARAEVEAAGAEVPAAFDWEEERTAFVRFAQRKEFGPSTQSLVDAAEARDVPWLRLNPYSLVQFGHGRYQRRIQATVTSETRHIAVEIASDKEETRNLLSDLGLPVPEQRLVYSPAEAVRAAERIGWPVVVKPLNANHGRGISINLQAAAEVERAFAVAREHGTGRGVLVEQFVRGFDHRMLVVNGRLVAVAKRVPGHVVGDGRHTIAELVGIVNEDPRRGIGHEKVLTQLQLDEQALRLMERAGHTPETVLPEGEVFSLRSTANLSTGGTAIDLTDVVHPDNREMAVRAIKAVGLDVGGVDFLTEDVTQSYKDVGGAIVECNAAPGFRMHVAPSEGKPRDVAGPVLDMLFPPGAPARIPIAAVTGTNGKTTTSRMLAHVLKAAGHVVGLTTTDGVYIDGHLSVKGDMTGPQSAQIVLRDPSVDAAVLETARGGLLRSGLGFRRCDVAACLNVQADHLGLRGIGTLDELAEVKRIPIEVARDTAVLNADDERCLLMAAHTDAEHVCYVTMNPQHPLVREHVQAGGRAVVLEQAAGGEMITLYDRGAHIPLVWAHLVPATLEGRARHNIQNAMFAAAMAYAMGTDAAAAERREAPTRVSLEDIRHGLRTFVTTFYQAPGRLNFFEEYPFRVLLDYAHNPAAVQALCDVVAALPAGGRKTLVLAAPGDRRDEDIREIAEIAAPHFARFICKADDHRRGRGHDEVPQMLRETLRERGVADDAIAVIPDEEAAVRHALETAAPGDLVVILGDEITRTWKQIVHFGDASRAAVSSALRAAPTPGDGTEGAAPEAAPPARQAPAPPAVPEAIADGKYVRDRRGVRLAQHDEEAD